MSPSNPKLPPPPDQTPRDDDEPGTQTVLPLRRTWQDLAHYEDRFRLLVESVSDYAIFLLDPDGYIQSWNSGAERFKGYTAHEAVGRHFSMFYTAEDIARQHPQAELAEARAVGKFEEEGWRVRKDGRRFWANVVITRLTTEDGRIVGFAKVTRDLTQRREAEEHLRLSEERFRLLVSEVKDYAIFMLDPDGTIATWNEGARRLNGYTPEEIIGKHFSVFYPQEDNDAGKPKWELDEAAITGRFEDEGWRLRKDGTRFWANVVVTALRQSDGTLFGYSKVTRDMTDRRRLEEKLRRSNEELERRVRDRTAQLQQALTARDEFMSIVSHELRTPVTSLKLQVQAAERQFKRGDLANFYNKAQKFVSGAGRQLDRLARLIEDMLDVSRISMDRLALDYTVLNLSELVSETFERFEPQCNAPCTLRATEAVMVRGDRLRLEQVFANLILNAIKYGADKPIEIRVTQAGGRAFVAVKDHGMGIAPEDHQRIFLRFERAVPARNLSGMGLGLYISTKIVEAHAGEIHLQSELGEGSTFTVILPLSTPSTT